MARPQPSSWPLITALVAWFLTYFGARGWIEMMPAGSSAIYVAAALPAIPFVALAVLLVRAYRTADELERRIQLEALAFAFPLTMLLLMVLGLLETGMTLNKDDLGYRHVWAFLPMAYLTGMILARRRYAQ